MDEIIMLPSIRDYWDWGSAIWDHLASERGKRIEAQLQSIELTNSTADLLSGLHGYKPLERGGYKWPIVIWKPSEDLCDVDSVLTTLDYDFVPTFDPDSNFLKARKQKVGKNMYNGTTFVLKEADLDENRIKLSCGIGNYFDAVSSCDALEHELLDAARKKGVTTSKDIFEHCPRRAKFLSICGDPARLGSGRSAAIGLSCLVAYRHKEQYRTILRVRSSGVAAHPGKYHVIPAGMFGADTEWTAEEFSLKHSFFREYQEELFEEKEIHLQRPTGQISHDWFYDKKQLQFLIHLLKTKKATLEVTGYSLNLTNYRPEVLMMLLIDDPKWDSQTLSTNYEYVSPQDIKDSGKSTLAPVLLNDSDEKILKKLLMIDQGFVPPGIAALWAGKKALDKRNQKSSSRGH